MSIGFINMQSSFSEGVGLSKPPIFSNNIRYQLAKYRVDDLFLKWLSMPATQKLVSSLINDVKTGKQSKLISQPSAYFTNKLAIAQGMSQSTLLSSPNQKHTVRITPTTPPRNESFNELKNQRQNSEDMQSSLTLSQIQNFQNQKKSEKEIQAGSSLNTAFASNLQYENIPQFYFPDGKQVESNILNEQSRIISDAFKQGKNDEIELENFLAITLACGLPKSLNQLLFNKFESKKISKIQFLKVWQQYLLNKEAKQRCFWVLKKTINDFIEFDDFKPYMKILLESHPGLEFLQATPEFQERYADTVIHRIFYKVNRRDNGKISWREFKQSDIFQVMEIVDKEEDINKIRNYFSYEHFYVIYCKFWELDSDHDFHISKEDFQRYSGHGLSRKVVDRIFEQVPRKFKSKQQGKMSYDDFIWFILSEEDKTTIQSIEYWFKVIDIDDNGMITGSEMEYFFDEQRQRMDYLNHEPVLFQDLVCQMVDLLHPDKDIIFTLKHFKDNLQMCGVFFNFLTNLNKLVAYEQRDPFQVKHELNEHPDYSDWDRFAQQEYLRLAMEEENQDNGDVLDSENPWDNDSEDSRNS